jgi:hypothetical protein
LSAEFPKQGSMELKSPEKKKAPKPAHTNTQSKTLQSFDKTKEKFNTTGNDSKILEKPNTKSDTREDAKLKSANQSIREKRITF